MSRTPDITRALEEAAREATAQMTELVRGKAVGYAPVDEGTLRDSAATTPPIRKEHSYEATVSFNTPYAAIQHESTSFNHPKGGRAKYLEEALKELVPHYNDLLQSALRRNL